MMKLSDINHSKITNFVAEIYFEELQFLLGEKSEREFWVKNHGMNSRAFSKDVLDLTSYAYVAKNDIKEAVFIHLSRNSIYHQLPEMFFYPLVISNPSMSNREIVDVIKENRKKQEGNLKFFIPFDTELFRERYKLSERYLNIYTDDHARKNLFSLANSIVKIDISLSKEQLYKFFLNLCNAEKFKESLPELEKLFRSLLGYTVTLKYITRILKESPFMSLGEGVLGFDLGTHGTVISEQDDICATIVMEDKKNYITLKNNITIIKQILSFFIFSNRDINVQYRFISSKGFELGKNYLGFDTILDMKEDEKYKKKAEKLGIVNI